MEKKKKILIVNTVGLNWNGISTIMYDYYSRFNTDRFEMHTVSELGNDQKMIQKFTEAGIIMHQIPSRKKNTVRYFWSLLRLIKTFRFKVVHINGNSATISIELFASLLAGCKIRIAHSHNSTCEAKKVDKLLRPFFHCLYTHAFACGDAAGKWLFGKNGYEIIKNGRDIDIYRFQKEKRQSTRNALKITGDILAIGHIGNFNEQKNHEFLINIFNALYETNNNSRLFLAGYGHCEGNIRELVHRLHLDNAVIFLGVIDNVPDILQAMDVMVLPSLYEGLPLVVVEWQISDLPCLISDVITKECSYSDLVKFQSLKDSYTDWVKAIMNLSKHKRGKDSDDVLYLTGKNGYDIDKNVVYLQEKIDNEVRRFYHTNL